MSPVNRPVEKREMSAAQATTGSQRRSERLDKLVDDAIHQREHVVAELGVEEALELLALRGVTLATGLAGELRAGEMVEEFEHCRIAPGVAARELAIEHQPHGEIGQPIDEVLAQFHHFLLRRQLPPRDAFTSRSCFSMI